MIVDKAAGKDGVGTGKSDQADRVFECSESLVEVGRIRRAGEPREFRWEGHTQVARQDQEACEAQLQGSSALSSMT